VVPADIRTYLHEIKTHLHLDSKTENRVLTEISAHFQEKVSELEREGFSKDAAEREAVSSFGEAKVIARSMYEAFSRGTWVDAFMSFQPHAIAAALFATHYWNNPIILFAALTFITVVTVMGWRNGSPAWMYSWAGYAFFPLIIAAFLFRHPMVQILRFVFLGVGAPISLWALAGLLAYYTGATWFMMWAVAKVARKDWLFVSLMLLPLPVLGIWALAVEHSGIPMFAYVGEAASAHAAWDSALAFFCFVLGLASTVFIRVRRRMIKAVAIIVVGMFGGALLVCTIRGDMGVSRIFIVSLCLLGILVSPLILHAFFDHETLEDRRRAG
jgi:hypothetical protein